MTQSVEQTVIAAEDGLRYLSWWSASNSKSASMKPKTQCCKKKKGYFISNLIRCRERIKTKILLCHNKK
jgi:hypothetical protein